MPVPAKNVAATFLLLLLAVGVLGADTQPAAQESAVTLVARSIQPGELVIVSVPAVDDAVSVRITVFGRTVPAHRSPGAWQALVGVDLDQRPGAFAVRADVELSTTVVTYRSQLVVQPKQFARRVLRVAPEFVDPPPSILDRIADEAAFLRAVFAQSASTRLWQERFVRPVPGRSNSRFGVRSVFNGRAGSPHTGADFLSGAGTPVRAPNAGLVLAARELFYSGNTVIIDHGQGLFSTLAHLSRIDIGEGDSVSAGQILGLVGATGRVTGPHLHWALRVSGARVDPLSVLALLGTADGDSSDASVVE